MKINGKPLRDKAQLTSISGYVEKQDLFSGTLTVRETLLFQAMLRMDENESNENKLRRVDQIMADVY